jgi:hypothetical protein
MLTNAFELDVSFSNQRPPCPHIDKFIARFLPELNQLFDLWEIKHSKSKFLFNFSRLVNLINLDILCKLIFIIFTKDV